MRRRLMVGVASLSVSLFTASLTVAKPAELVSPAGLVEARCPTFSWSAVAGAAGY